MVDLKTYLIVGAVAIAASTSATAMPVDPVPTYSECTATISTLVTNAYDCEISSAEQDKLNTDPITVNAGEGFFDITSWSFLEKDEGASGTGQTGTTKGSGDFSLYDVVMAVFKDGQDTSLVGYLLNVAGGTWDSPFREPDFAVGANTIKDVSHISYYGYCDDPNGCDGGDTGFDVPLPAGLPLLLTGLGVLGIARTRRKS